MIDCRYVDVVGLRYVDVVCAPRRTTPMTRKPYPDHTYGDSSNVLPYERANAHTTLRIIWLTAFIQIVDGETGEPLPGFAEPLEVTTFEDGEGDPAPHLRPYYRPAYGDGAGELRGFEGEEADYVVLWTGTDADGEPIVADGIPLKVKKPFQAPD